MCRKYKPNNTYILEIHGCQYYIGAHTQKDEMTEARILLGSGNSLTTAKQKHHITLQEYKDCCKLIYIEEYDTPQEAKAREAELISKFRETFGNRCLNQSPGNGFGPKGIPIPEYRKEKISKNAKGKTRSAEARQHMSEARKGKTHAGKPILQYDMQGNFVKEYPTLREASQQTGINVNSICQCCKGTQKSAGKSTWQYKPI